VFTRSSVTPPKVNRYECNLEHTEYTFSQVGPGRFSGAICVVARAEETGESFIFCQLSTRDFTDLPEAKFDEI